MRAPLPSSVNTHVSAISVRARESLGFGRAEGFCHVDDRGEFRVPVERAHRRDTSREPSCHGSGGDGDRRGRGRRVAAGRDERSPGRPGRVRSRGRGNRSRNGRDRVLLDGRASGQSHRRHPVGLRGGGRRRLVAGSSRSAAAQRRRSLRLAELSPRLLPRLRFPRGAFAGSFGEGAVRRDGVDHARVVPAVVLLLARGRRRRPAGRLQCELSDQRVDDRGQTVDRRRFWHGGAISRGAPGSRDRRRAELSPHRGFTSSEAGAAARLRAGLAADDPVWRVLRRCRRADQPRCELARHRRLVPDRGTHHAHVGVPARDPPGHAVRGSGP